MGPLGCPPQFNSSERPSPRRPDLTTGGVSSERPSAGALCGGRAPRPVLRRSEAPREGGSPLAGGVLQSAEVLARRGTEDLPPWLGPPAPVARSTCVDCPQCSLTARGRSVDRALPSRPRVGGESVGTPSDPS